MWQRIKARCRQRWITHFAMSAQRERFLSRFALVDRIFKPVQWFALIGVLVALAAAKKTTIGLGYRLMIFALAVGLFSAASWALLPLLTAMLMAIDPLAFGVGRSRAYKAFVGFITALIVLGFVWLFVLVFQAILAVYLPAPPPQPETYPFGT